MLKISLYKNCILSHDYNEVFHYSIFEDYLNTLTKYSLPDLDYAYQELNGVLYFDYEIEGNSIYDYNYMKVETYDENGIFKFKRYCFIKNIKLANNIAIVEYEEDIWQSYSKDLNIRNSFLSRSKILNYTNNTISIYHLPIEYSSNKKLLETTINQQPSTQLYRIAAQIQVYKTGTSGEVTTRKCFTTFLYHLKFLGMVYNEPRYEYKVAMNLETAIKSIKIFYDGVSHSVTNDWHYQVDNITLIPDYFFNQGIFGTYFKESSNEGPDFLYDYFDNEGMAIVNSLFVDMTNDTVVGIGLKEEYAKIVAKGKQLIYSGNIANHFKNISFGTMTNQFDIVNNGINHYYKLYVEMNTYNFDIYLEFDNKMISITNDFLINMPYENLTSEAVAQRKMAKNLNTIRSVGNIVEGAVAIATGIGIAGSTKAIAELGKTARKNSKKSLIGAYRQNKANYEEMQDIGWGSGNIVTGITGLIGANQPNYASSKGTFSYDDGILNAYYGLVLKYLDSDNDTIVENYINETGYITFQIGNNEFLLNYNNPNVSSSPSYNVLKFDFVKAYGKFSQDICDELKEILLNGFKIRYTSNV